jgi:uncharacterized protein
MRLRGIVWLAEIVDKLALKHAIEPYEVEELLDNEPDVRFVEKGERKGEDVFAATGHSDAGRYLIVIFIYKLTKEALILSARDMTRNERRRYGKKQVKETAEV